MSRIELIARLQDNSVVQDVFSASGQWLTRELLLVAKAEDALSAKTTITFNIVEVNDRPELSGSALTPERGKKIRLSI